MVSDNKIDLQNLEYTIRNKRTVSVNIFVSLTVLIP